MDTPIPEPTQEAPQRPAERTRKDDARQEPRPAEPATGEGLAESFSPAARRAPMRRGVARWALFACGVLFAALGTVGAFLPVLPTTPFLLLAAACFVRSSPAMHRKLLRNRVFGPYVREWQRHRTIPLRAKRKAYGLVVITFSISIALVGVMWLRVLLGVVGGLLLVFLVRLPSSVHD